jgi:hypothetical protein
MLPFSFLTSAGRGQTGIAALHTAGAVSLFPISDCVRQEKGSPAPKQPQELTAAPVRPCKQITLVRGLCFKLSLNISVKTLNGMSTNHSALCWLN